MGMIDYHDSRPIYEQIAEWYKGMILKGVLSADEKLPSVRKLAMDLSTNPNTVQKAYGELERQGFIYTVKGRGNFVRENDSLREEKLEELKAEMIDLLSQARDLGVDLTEFVRQAVLQTEEKEVNQDDQV